MRSWVVLCAVTLGAWLLFQGAGTENTDEKLARFRNLGKAFYENPTTQKEAVEEFRKALALAPNSTRERLNYGLALLRAGRTPEGIAELEKVQKQDPSLPHTWFNLGVQYKKLAESEKAIEQFRGMLKLVPDEPISHYNLGALYKSQGDAAQAIQEFSTAARLDSNLAAPHFQLFNMYRTTDKPEEAKKELDIFQGLKKQQDGSEDLEWSRFAEVYDIMADTPPAQAVEAAYEKTAIPGAASGVQFIDANGDGKPVMLLWSSQDIRLQPGGRVAEIAGVTSIATGDFNNDGLVDFCALTPSEPVLFVNKGGGKFERLAANLPKARFNKAVWIDYDHDYDLDLILLGPKSMLFRNQGAAGFQDHTAEFPFAEGEAIDAARLRVVADTKGMDLAVAYKDRSGTLYRDQLAGKYAAEPLAVPANSHDLQALDLNNDGWLDLAFVAGTQLQALRNQQTRFSDPVTLIGSGVQGFTHTDTSNRGVQDLIAAGHIWQNAADFKFVQQASPGLPDCSSGDVADVTGAGHEDVACVSGSQAYLLANRTTAKNGWTEIKITGIKNLKTAPASEIEIKSGARYQKLVYTGLPLHFGIGTETAIDTVRITWPNGLIQNELKQAPGKRLAYQEAQRLSGSCPMIWTWNGTEFEYITDVLGVAPLGASSGDGQFFPVDHQEFIQIPGSALKPVNGKFEIRISEELSEVAYVDQVQLTAVDHPADTTIITNEKFKSPPFPEYRLFGVEEKIRPVAARDGRGRDVLGKILQRDRAYPDEFRRNLSGVAELHTLDLDFGKQAARDNRAVLVLNGWVDWADGSTFLSAAQESKEGLITPYLQVKDRNGAWKTVVEDMGMPAGKPKTIAVDLTGKFLSDSREVRIVTNLCVYWDEIYLGASSAPPVVRETTLNPAFADLHFRGFSPNRIDASRKQPEMFFYQNARSTSMWNPTPGMYTRYGDVRELTDAVDDKLVVMGSGDELRLEFLATSLPRLPQGWVREYILKVDGWAKDRDANTAYSQSTEPLPFHGMSRFPYPSSERYPDDAEHRKYRSEYLTRPALRLIRPLRASAR